VGDPLSRKTRLFLIYGSFGPYDVTKKEDLENLVADISKKEKYINLLVTNAGISGPKAEPDSENASELKETRFKSESFSKWCADFISSFILPQPPRCATSRYF